MGLTEHPPLKRLSGYQRDLLVAVDQSPDDAGAGIREYLESEYGETVTHSQFYPNLDELAERGLIEKSERAIDDRTNSYTTTARGRTALRKHAAWVLGEDDD